MVGDAGLQRLPGYPGIRDGEHPFLLASRVGFSGSMRLRWQKGQRLGAAVHRVLLLTALTLRRASSRLILGMMSWGTLELSDKLNT